MQQGCVTFSDHHRRYGKIVKTSAENSDSFEFTVDSLFNFDGLPSCSDCVHLRMLFLQYVDVVKSQSKTIQKQMEQISQLKKENESKSSQIDQLCGEISFLKNGIIEKEQELLQSQNQIAVEKNKRKQSNKDLHTIIQSLKESNESLCSKISNDFAKNKNESDPIIEKAEEANCEANDEESLSIVNDDCLNDQSGIDDDDDDKYTSSVYDKNNRFLFSLKDDSLKIFIDSFVNNEYHAQSLEMFCLFSHVNFTDTSAFYKIAIETIFGYFPGVSTKILLTALKQDRSDFRQLLQSNFKDSSLILQNMISIMMSILIHYVSFAASNVLRNSVPTFFCNFSTKGLEQGSEVSTMIVIDAAKNVVNQIKEYIKHHYGYLVSDDQSRKWISLISKTYVGQVKESQMQSSINKVHPKESVDANFKTSDVVLSFVFPSIQPSSSNTKKTKRSLLALPPAQLQSVFTEKTEVKLFRVLFLTNGFHVNPVDVQSMMDADSSINKKIKKKSHRFPKNKN